MRPTAEKESPATGQGRGADNVKSFSGLDLEASEYSPSPSLAMANDLVSARLAAIDWTYRQKRKRRGRVTMPALRLRELERILAHWWTILPDSSDGRVFVRIVANHLVGLEGDPYQRIGTWCDRFAPWLDEDEFEEVVELATISPTHYTADSIANAIGLDIATRDALCIKTIGAYDFSKADREERRRLNHAARQRIRRRKNSRPQSVAKSKPWAAEGISERTWYRRRRKDIST